MNTTAFILGLDVGTNSVGWAMLFPGGGIVRTGVRVFEAGNEGEIDKGKDESRAVKRRQARLQRRNLWRRAWRLGRWQNFCSAR